MSRTAYVDLSTGKIDICRTDPVLMKKYIGGRGYAGKILSDSVNETVEPLSPENLLIFSIGCFGGTVWPTSGRGHVTFKSPVTGAYGHANFGGTVGAELARCGYDAVVISGSAAKPVYLYVSDEQMEIRPAEDLWGLETGAVCDALENEGKVAAIGPAGENLVKIAAIIGDRNRAAARGGGGAVMGSKKLKAVVVKSGSVKKMPEEFTAFGKSVFKRVHQDASLEALRLYGTSILVDIQNEAGSMPSKNHQTVQVEDVNRIKADTLHRYVLKGKGCYACPIKCGRSSQVSSGPYACATGGPEYESLAALGPMTLVDDIEALIYANLRCNELGLDTISAGVVIAFAMECTEKGLISDDTLSLEWGDTASMLTLLEWIAHRRGLGALLAEGSRGAALKIGGEAMRYAMQVKGLELPRQDPRTSKSFGFGHAVSNRGADHLYGLPTTDVANLRQVAEKFFDKDSVEELLDTDNEKYKPDIVRLGENYCAVIDSVGICKLISSENHCVTPDDVARGLSLLWDQPVTAEDVLLAGERIVNQERVYNIRHGLSRKDDYLPRRFFEEPVDVYEYRTNEKDGGLVRSGDPVRKGAVIRDFDAMLDRYYDLRGWDRDGKPTRQTLQRLDLVGE